MSPRATLFNCWFAVAAASGGALGAEAQLASRSPFAPKAGAGAVTPATATALEFFGYYEDAAGRLFRIRDSVSKKGFWLRLNERSDDPKLIVKQHDEEQRTITVEHDGRTLTLATREAKIVSSGPLTAAAVMPPMPSNVPPAVTQAVVLNPTPADEARRLDSVAAEVARRRALRVQAEQNVNQPTAGAPPPPGMPPPPNQPR